MPLLGYGAASLALSGLAPEMTLNKEPGCHSPSGGDSRCLVPCLSGYGGFSRLQKKKPQRRPPERIQDQQKLLQHDEVPIATKPPAPSSPLAKQQPLIQPVQLLPPSSPQAFVRSTAACTQQKSIADQCEIVSLVKELFVMVRALENRVILLEKSLLTLGNVPTHVTNFGVGVGTTMRLVVGVMRHLKVTDDHIDDLVKGLPSFSFPANSKG